ncbi:MAG: ketopantoate reductase family protein [Alkalispirochaeta sp.]
MKQTLIVGAGALGAMYAERLEAAGLPVAFLADGPRAERLRTAGVVVNGRRLRIPVETVADRKVAGHIEADRTVAGHTGAGRPARRPPDYVLVALKHHHLPAALPAVAEVVGEETIVFSVMNGIDSEAQLAEALGDSRHAGRVVHAMVAGMDAVREGLEVHYTRLGKVWIGERTNDPHHPTARVQRLAQHLEQAGIAWEVPADMEYMIWNKFMLNVGINQWSAVLKAPYGVFHRQETARSLVRTTMQEVMAVAGAVGVELTEADVERWFEIIGTLSPEGETSMLQDVYAGRKTEVEMFAGRVVELGHRWNVPTPLNTALLRAIQVIEAEGLRQRG